MKLENVSAIFIDEISMVSAKLLLQIHQRLCEIFGKSDSIPFAGKTIIVSGDLYFQWMDLLRELKNFGITLNLQN